MNKCSYKLYFQFGEPHTVSLQMYVHVHVVGTINIKDMSSFKGQHCTHFYNVFAVTKKTMDSAVTNEGGFPHYRVP